MARQTIAQKWQAEARVEQAAQTLLQQIPLRFGKLPPDVERTIRGTTELPRLEEWLRRFATANSLDELGIPLAP
jgi:hypothetical protein